MCQQLLNVIAGTVDDKGMYTDTEDVDCAVCKCDMWLCAVVSPSCPEKAVCTEHATHLGCPRKEQILLYRCVPQRDAHWGQDAGHAGVDMLCIISM